MILYWYGWPKYPILRIVLAANLLDLAGQNQPTTYVACLSWCEGAIGNGAD